MVNAFNFFILLRASALPTCYAGNRSRYMNLKPMGAPPHRVASFHRRTSKSTPLYTKPPFRSTSASIALKGQTRFDTSQYMDASIGTEDLIRNQGVGTPTLSPRNPPTSEFFVSGKARPKGTCAPISDATTLTSKQCTFNFAPRDRAPVPPDLHPPGIVTSTSGVAGRTYSSGQHGPSGPLPFAYASCDEGSSF
jgi:hypothetical protein